MLFIALINENNVQMLMFIVANALRYNLMRMMMTSFKLR